MRKTIKGKGKAMVVTQSIEFCDSILQIINQCAGLDKGNPFKIAIAFSGD